MRAICWTLCFGLTLCLLGADVPTTTPAPRETLTIDLGGGVGMEFVLIKAGSFMMGRTGAAESHKVTITKPFYIGKFEVTQEQWQAMMGVNPSHFKNPKNPVENVSWEDCMSFLVRLSKKIPDRAFALPAEAQWEYACRAGTTSIYSFGNPISLRDPGALADYAWFAGDSESQSHAVGKKKPNPWGLYDMHGNVWEWCSDWFTPYTADDVIDPTGAAQGTEHMMRGGGWQATSAGLGSHFRSKHTPDYRSNYVGVRVICMP